MEKTKSFKYMRASEHRIVGRADIQMFWLDRISDTCIEIKEDGNTKKLKYYINTGIRTGDTLYTTELSRLGENWQDLKENLTLLRKKEIHVVPLRYSLSAKSYNKDFMAADPKEQVKCLYDAQSIYKEEACTPMSKGPKGIKLDSPEEESLLLAVVKNKISREESKMYFNVGHNVLQRELYRKEAELLAKEDLIMPLTEEVLAVVKEQAKERSVARNKIWFADRRKPRDHWYTEY